MSKKTLDTSEITNELEGASAFFKPSPIAQAQSVPKSEPQSEIAKPQGVDTAATSQETAKPVPEPTVPPEERPPVRPHARTERVRVRRTITRYAFEFFQDQIETLKGFSLNEQLNGEKGSMSQMVREAIDAYIAKRKRTED